MTAPTRQPARSQVDFGELPPMSWFTDPCLPMLTPLTLTREGRVFGHLAGWGVPHRGITGTVFAPRSRTNYARFVNKTAVVAGDDGEPHMIAAANLTMDTKHASMTASLADVSDHYDHSGTIFAQVAVFEDAHGIAYSGAVLPDATPAQLRRALACAGSGDWRRHDPTRSLELCAALLVPCEGFEQTVPRARVASGAPMALVAAGMVMPRATSFARRVDPTWGAAAGAGLDVDTLADRIAERLDARKAAAELAARHTALVSEVDDTPAVHAALLAEVDDTPQRMAAVLAELGEDGVDESFNWVEKAGGLPPYIKRISKHLEEKGMDTSHAIATAVNVAKKMCSTGDLNYPGLQHVNPGSKAEACASVADWEAKKARSKGGH